MIIAASALAVLASGERALAWGAVGHVMISRLGAQAFPASLPAFVRSQAAVDEIALLGPEPDRLKGAGETFDDDLSPAHYLDLGDDGRIGGAVALASLPSSQREYDADLRTAGSDEFRTGYLPYAIIDGWQRIAKDFAIWRVDRVGETRAGTATLRTAFAADRALQEMLTIRDIGVWSHFVADGSQPLHVTVHFNGWGEYPNPNGYSTEKTVHAFFETTFVGAHATAADVSADIRPLRPSNDPIAALVENYLRTTSSYVVPLYQIEKANGFAQATPAAIAFTDARIADGAAEMRDLVTDAWNASGNLPDGYGPAAVTPLQAESGSKPVSASLLAGGD